VTTPLSNGASKNATPRHRPIPVRPSASICSVVSRWTQRP
jgi:hypothetical protein